MLYIYIHTSGFSVLSYIILFVGVYSCCFIPALETVDADKVYVLGGLVDESIQKVLR